MYSSGTLGTVGEGLGIGSEKGGGVGKDIWVSKRPMQGFTL
jgi:hypothetical protein